MAELPPFHLAFPVHDIEAARAFYGALLGCPEGRSADEWIDFDFFGHQIVAHLAPAREAKPHDNRADGHDVPVPYSGALLSISEGQAMPDRPQAGGAPFVIEPTIRFRG